MLRFMEKKCPKCQQVLPYEMFGSDSSRSNGRKSHCKKCVKIWKKRVGITAVEVNKLKVLDKGFRERRGCRKKTFKAIKSGKLVKGPCETCGKTPAQTHHEDYAKPLEVRWLCASCHGKEHYRKRMAAADSAVA